MTRTALVFSFSLIFTLACGSDDPPGDGLGDSGGSSPSDALVQDLGSTITPDVGERRDFGPATDSGPEDLGSRDTGQDAGAPLDMGPGQDAGPGRDLGPGRDVGPSVDMGGSVGLDGSLSPDLGGAVDGGPIDGGMLDSGTGVGLDASTPGDGGSIVDGGGATDAGAGPLCDPTFGATPPTCGGNPAGTWSYREVCGNSGLEAEVRMLCPTATLSNVVRTATGTLSFVGTGYTLALFERGSATVNVPALCALLAGGCSAIPGLLSSSGVTGTCTSASGGGCTCMASARVTIQETGTFMRSGATIVAGMRTFDHCVQNSRLFLRDRTTDSVYVLD